MEKKGEFLDRKNVWESHIWLFFSLQNMGCNIEW